MNLSTDESNPFNFSAYNNTEVENDIEMSVSELVVYIITILMSFPLNSYVISLIVRGTGNGVAAEFLNLNFSICEVLYCIECVLISLSYVFESVCNTIFFLDGLSITARPLFQCLICVERYLAVIYPVTFLKYKPLRYRLMCSAVAWLMCFCSCTLNFMAWFFLLDKLSFIFYLAQFFVFLSIQLFCCVAVLRVLKQSGPGEREEENYMKRRAFYLILITTVTMLILYAPHITLTILGWSSSQHIDIILPISNVCFLFAGLVQPLLFLYRVGKLTFKCQ